MNLRDVPTLTLERELRDRRRCVDCAVETSAAWHAVDTNRRRCDACQTMHRKRNPSLFGEASCR